MDETADLLQRQFGLLVEPPLGAQQSAASSTHPSLHWLRLSHQGKPSALNKAMQLVDTEMVLTVDADTLLEQNAIRAMRNAFAWQISKLVAATGILTPVCGPSLSGRWFPVVPDLRIYSQFFCPRCAWMQMDGLLLISGAFAAFRRQAVVEVGGFDPACLVEDYELIHRLRRYSVLNHRGWTTSRCRRSVPRPDRCAGFGLELPAAATPVVRRLSANPILVSAAWSAIVPSAGSACSQLPIKAGRYAAADLRPDRLCLAAHLPRDRPLQPEQSGDRRDRP